jgi:hypothetical protein
MTLFVQILTEYHAGRMSGCKSPLSTPAFLLRTRTNLPIEPRSRELTTQAVCALSQALNSSPMPGCCCAI